MKKKAIKQKKQHKNKQTEIHARQQHNQSLQLQEKAARGPLGHQVERSPKQIIVYNDIRYLKFYYYSVTIKILFHFLEKAACIVLTPIALFYPDSFKPKYLLLIAKSFIQVQV